MAQFIHTLTHPNTLHIHTVPLVYEYMYVCKRIIMGVNAGFVCALDFVGQTYNE